MKIALVVGHTGSSPGCVDPRTGMTEFKFNSEVAELIMARLHELPRLDLSVVYRDTYKGLPGKINALNPDLIVSMHCNAFNGLKAGGVGSEVLYWHTSARSKRMAEICQEYFVKGQLGVVDRGIKPLTSMDQRGAWLLRHTAAPCVICEPFFLDDDDYDIQLITQAYIDILRRLGNGVI